MVLIVYGKIKIIVESFPNFYELNKLISSYNIKHIIRVCDASYGVNEENIKKICMIHEYIFEDGSSPCSDMIYEWITFLFNYFYTSEISNIEFILAHCISGLGRSPLFVCIALIVCENMEPITSIVYMRKHIRYALNKKQIKFIEITNWSKYRNFFKKLFKKQKNNHCTIL